MQDFLQVNQSRPALPDKPLSMSVHEHHLTHSITSAEVWCSSMEGREFKGTWASMTGSSCPASLMTLARPRMFDLWYLPFQRSSMPWRTCTLPQPDVAAQCRPPMCHLPPGNHKSLIAIRTRTGVFLAGEKELSLCFLSTSCVWQPSPQVWTERRCYLHSTLDMGMLSLPWKPSHMLADVD